MNKLPISVFIISYNEADRIAKSIYSLKDIADEIIVVDSGSSDNTAQIAENTGAKVIYNKWPGYGPQKVLAEGMCKHDWVFNIDADEIATAELCNKLQNLFLTKELNQYSAFKVQRKAYFWFQTKPHPLAHRDYPIRFYNKKYAGFKSSTVHDSVVVNMGKIGIIKPGIIECSLRSFHHWIEKINNYTSMQAKEYHEKGRRSHPLKIIFLPFLGFWKAYIFKKYFIYGFKGIIYSYIYGFSRLLKHTKIYEKQEMAKKHEE